MYIHYLEQIQKLETLHKCHLFKLPVIPLILPGDLVGDGGSLPSLCAK